MSRITNSAEHGHTSEAWVKRGDFNRPFDPGTGTPIRTVSYQNTHRDALIDTFELIGYESGGFQLVITAKNPETYTTLVQALVAAGFRESNPVNRNMKIISIHIEDNQREIATRFLQQIDNTELLFATIKADVSQHLNIDLTWIRKGDFNHSYDPGTGLRRRDISYHNTHHDALIDRLKLVGYERGGFQLIVTAKNPETYTTLLQATSAAGFPEPEFIDRHLGRIGLYIEDNQRQLATLFLQQIDRTEPLFSTIKIEVSQHLNIDLSQHYQMPLWIRTGDFNRHLSPRSRRTEVSYQNTHRDALIDKFELLGYGNGYFELAVTAKNPRTYAILSQAIVSAGFPDADFSDQNMKIIRLRNAERQRFINFIEILAPIESLLSDIKAEIIEDIRQATTESNENHRTRRRARDSDIDEQQVAHVIQQSLFGASAPTTLPEQGKNAKELDTISGFNKKDIPDDLCCPLSGEIMDDPVYDPKYPQYKFERTWIEKRLANKREHPYTRTPLLINELLVSDELKNKIELFMNHARHETFCELRPGFLN